MITTILMALLCIVGIAFIMAGWKVRRQGSEPRCGLCEYNLTGLTGDCCPECGSMVTKAATVYGQRYRRWKLAAMGVLLMGLGLAVMSGPVRSYNWYQHKPTVWVIRDLQSQTSVVAKSAWNEMMLRDNAGDLSNEHRVRLIDVCLQEHASSQPGVLQQAMTNYLADLYLSYRLTEDQAEAFFHNVVHFKLEVRPVVLQGEAVPYQISVDMNGPTEHPDFWMGSGKGDILVNGKPMIRSYRTFYSDSKTDSWGSQGQLAVDEVGDHTCTIVMNVSIFEGPLSQKESRKQCFNGEIKLEGTFSVLDRAMPDPLRLIADPDVGTKLQTLITPTDIEYHQNDEKLEVTIKLEMLPVNVAFDVFAGMGGEEYRVDQICVSESMTTRWVTISTSLEEPPTGPCDIILRTSKKAAKSTPDLFEVWDGELIYEDVLIDRLK